MYQTQPKSSSHEAKDAARKKGKPFCKVCFDAGKSEKDYTSHYVKTEEGKVNCPTLLNQSCLNCGRPGHTSGYCDQAKSQKQRTQQTQPTIVLSNPRPIIGAEAELKLMTTMFKSKSQYKNDDFPSLKSEPKKQEPKKEEPNEEPNHEEPNHDHVYNPKSNPFGALTPTQPKQPNQKSFQPPQQQQTQPQQPQQQQSQAKPMTMAERLKNPAPIKSEPKPKPVDPIRPKFADMPPKSQFWWQDED
jgi:hypothetical protein